MLSMSSLDDKVDENTFYYEPRDLSDVTIVVNAIDKDCKHTGVVYRFCVHKIVLSFQCSWFNGVFSVDKDVKEVVMPDSFLYRKLESISFSTCDLNIIQLVFDTLYNIVDKCWWNFSLQQKRDIMVESHGRVINPVFYIGFDTLLNNLEQYLIYDHARGTGNIYNILGIVEAREYKMNKLEEYIVSELEKQLLRNPKDAYTHWINNKPDCFQHITHQQWQRFLKAACSIKN